MLLEFVTLLKEKQQGIEIPKPMTRRTFIITITADTEEDMQSIKFYFEGVLKAWKDYPQLFNIRKSEMEEKRQ